MSYNKKECDRLYYQKNKKKILKKQKEYAEKNKDKIRLYKREWARKRRMSTEKSLKTSQTYKGRKAELLALIILEGSKDMNKKVMNQPYDIEWKGERIDVKSCNLYKRKMKRGKPIKNCGGWWTFNKNKGTADRYFCICMENNKPKRFYLIPKKDFNNGIAIGKISNKFDKYLINYENEYKIV